MEFEFDPHKSLANLAKHGIDFESAQELWCDEERVEVEVDREGEPRFLVVGRMAGKHWTAVITYRGTSTRIISVRRARKKEVELYGR